MNPGGAIELIWHFAGYWHLAQDFAAERIDYDEALYSRSSAAYHGTSDKFLLPSPDLPDVNTQPIKFGYVAGIDQPAHHFDWAGLHHHSYEIISSKLYHPDTSLHRMPEVPGSAESLTWVNGGNVHAVRHVPTAQPTDQTGGPEVQHREPVYDIKYEDIHAGEIARLTQTNTLTDQDHFSDGAAGHASLQHVDSGETVSAMLDMAREVNPYPLIPSVESNDYWTSAVVAHDEALASGQGTSESLAAGRYVNGEFQEDGAQAPVRAADVQPPALPVHDDTSPTSGQVAETGANKASNVALVEDLNEAPATLVVGGNFYETNAILQANILQDRDHVVDAGGRPASVESGSNHTDNIADFDATDLVRNNAQHSFGGDLKVNIDVVDGNFVDVKSLTQHNYLEDGDVTVQTRQSSYSEVHAGEGEQSNIAKFIDWGKNYDVILVLGDYHSANIISQVNVVLDSDVIGTGSGAERGSGGAGSATVLSGQNTLQNHAAIHNYGATAFDALTDDLAKLLDGLGNHADLDRNAWSNFHGAASGNLDVLFVTGNYYDLNVITQVNVVADSDLAVQVAADGSSLQWLSTGGNVVSNFAEIVNAGGVYHQFVGGGAYEDSILLQANLVSDSTHTVATDPTVLVPEVVAFMEQAPSDAHANTPAWTKDVFGNHHDTFGHVLT